MQPTRANTESFRRIRTMRPFDNKNDSYLIFGTAWTNETYIHVRWGWLAFLTTQVVAGTTLLAFTIWSTAKAEEPITKSSQLAVMAALDSESRNMLGNIGPIREMEAKAEQIQVCLIGDQLKSSTSPRANQETINSPTTQP